MLAGGACREGRPDSREVEQNIMSGSATNFLHALAAVLGGNALYFLVEKYLPPAARHSLFKMDLGMVVDFCMCLALFLIIKSLAGRSDATKTDRG